LVFPMLPGLLLALALGTATPVPALTELKLRCLTKIDYAGLLTKPTVPLRSNVAPPNDRKGHAEFGKLLALESHRRLCSLVDQ